ncbi:MAG: GNAT family N-acetyltransferase [Defluviimonas sp.]|uniref:GNAT family N-acetyltransferase n=1 Tax=Albidovulum sp. TaxID=1872424 RepID=UPI001D8A991E|nr:GNAT family N-acetyltransferase [Paracoccaceae bacterium]MCC0064251.1 GNAT family N-acetyltransferase [Defluviimonas sp.]
MSAPSVRDAAEADAPAWRRLWQAYLDFYAVALAPGVTAATWARLMDPASPLKARVAEVGGQVAGFAIHQHHPSSWIDGDDCYLEDLFVDAAARGAGVGRALIDDLIVLARARGWKRLYWHTDEDNTQARALYDSYVATDGHVRYRIAL